MFKLIKGVLFLAFILGLSYFTFMVPLGDKTLYHHLQGISKTPEAKTLGDELGKKAKKTKATMRRDLGKTISTFMDNEDSSKSGIKPVDDTTNKDLSDEHSDRDRSALKSILKEKAQLSEKDKKALRQLLAQKDD